MFFESKTKKSLISSGEKMLRDYREIVLGAGVPNPDRDAVLLFSGFTHFAITVYVHTSQIKPKDIADILTACAMNIRKVTPNHNLDVSYLEETQTLVRQAIEAVKGDTLKWTKAYYDALHGKVQIDEATFLGTLTGDCFNVLQTAQ